MEEKLILSRVNNDLIYLVLKFVISTYMFNSNCMFII